MKTKVEKLKEEGNEYFGAAKYTLAIEKYEVRFNIEIESEICEATFLGLDYLHLYRSHN